MHLPEFGFIWDIDCESFAFWLHILYLCSQQEKCLVDTEFTMTYLLVILMINVEYAVSIFLFVWLSMIVVFHHRHRHRHLQVAQIYCWYCVWWGTTCLQYLVLDFVFNILPHLDIVSPNRHLCVSRYHVGPSPSSLYVFVVLGYIPSMTRNHL